MKLKSKQRGFMSDRDFLGFMLIILVIGIALGVGAVLLINKGWPLLKVWLHAATA